jgi:HSP20 family protein
MLQQEINSLFERLAVLSPGEASGAGDWAPSVDVFERGGTLVIVAEVPGLDPESLEVSCLDHQVVISGRRRERRPGGSGVAFVCMERGQGRFSRAIPLDGPVDAARAEATLAKGLLTVRLPRLEDRRGHRTLIPVRREVS